MLRKSKAALSVGREFCGWAMNISGLYVQETLGDSLDLRVKNSLVKLIDIWWSSLMKEIANHLFLWILSINMANLLGLKPALHYELAKPMLPLLCPTRDGFH